MGNEGNGPISLTAYARHRGVSVPSVSKAVRRQRLKDSVVRVDGQPKIRSLEEADREWEANTDRSRRPDYEGRRAAGGRPPESSLVPAKTLAEAQRRVAFERERKLKLENGVAEGWLVPKALVAKEAFESTRIIREGLMNLPARLAGELAAEMDPVKMHLALDKAIREALNETADRLLAQVNV